MSGFFLFCSSYCKGLLELMSCKQPQKPLSSVLSFPKWMCVRIPLPYPVFFSSKMGNIYQSPPGTAADPPPGWISFCCFPLENLGGCNPVGGQGSAVPEDKYLPGKWTRDVPWHLRNVLIYPFSLNPPLGFQQCLNLELFQTFPTVLQEPCAQKPSKKTPVPSKYPCIRRFRTISLIVQKFLNLESS